MVDVKRYAIAGGTFACILATGFFMQSGGKTPRAINTADVGSMGMQPQAPATDSGEISDIALTSADGQSPADVSPNPQEMAPPATEDMTEAKVTLPDDVAPVTAPVDFAPIQTPDPDEAPVEVSLLVDPDAASNPRKRPCGRLARGSAIGRTMRHCHDGRTDDGGSGRVGTCCPLFAE